MKHLNKQILWKIDLCSEYIVLNIKTKFSLQSLKDKYINLNMTLNMTLPSVPLW